MTPEQEQKLNEVYEFMKLLRTSYSIPFDVDVSFRERLSDEFVKLSNYPNGLSSAPFPAVSAPSGGATVDSQARAAINSIITNLEDAGIQLPN